MNLGATIGWKPLESKPFNSAVPSAILRQLSEGAVGYDGSTCLPPDCDIVLRCLWSTSIQTRA
jgi:hypothetical protein